ncbi:ADP-ribose glycohydrolase OARD1 [Episyrphus balteatus]|uniref:ADP-ribose glycohydrolase OARD1 n=1 Tax=Episyrphus balteatus TaxID=286459 RepID=UPI002485E58F|nr:ADP-ribose glycohydrolase OARD1 [Episyrphus balteatus]
MLKLTEISGNIFSASEEFALAHCVGADLKMAKGIAVEFVKRFGQKENLRKQNVRRGGVAVLKDGCRFIYYLVTKDLSYQPTTYETMFSSLNAMRTHMLANEVTKLAIPRIGCGVDKLIWSKVKSQIEEVFANDSIEIVVYNYIQSNN